MKRSLSLANFRSPVASIARIASQHRLDWAIALVLAAIAAWAVSFGDGLIDLHRLADKAFDDVWFTADIPRVVRSMAVSPQKGSLRFFLHPLFAEFTYPPVWMLQHVFGLKAIAAVRVVMAIVAASWLGLFYALLRLVGCRRFDAVLLSLLAAVSAASVFWFVVPESFTLSSVGILVALAIAAWGQRLPLSPGWYAVANVLTLGFTVTNWMFGILATAVNLPRKRSVGIILASFFGVGICSAIVPAIGWAKNHLPPIGWVVLFLLAGIGIAIVLTVAISVRRLHPNFNPWNVLSYLLQQRFVQIVAAGACLVAAIVFVAGEREFMLLPQSGGPLAAVRAFFLHSMVMPSIHLVDLVEQHDLSVFPKMTIQGSAAGSGSPWGAVTVGLWAALLGLGFWSLFSLKSLGKFRWVLGLTLLGQLILHLLYGAETFLYALDFAPVLLAIAALSTLTRFRGLALVFVVLVTIGAGANNIVQYQQAIAYFQHYN